MRSKKEKYIDITDKFLEEKEYEVEKQQYYIDKDNKKYMVDDRHIIMRPSYREEEVAHILGRIYGGKIIIQPRVNEPSSIKTSDYIIEGEAFDLKCINGKGNSTLDNAIKKKEKQAHNFIFDVSETELGINEIIKQIQKIYNSEHRIWVDSIILVKYNVVLKVFKRNK